MKYRKLGPELEVSALGLGCMPMAGIGKGMYGTASRAESLATIDRAIELGVTFFDTAEVTVRISMKNCLDMRSAAAASDW
jgi:aryl-alcohol dehydrogenase-like predicted oxidoreductase